MDTENQKEIAEEQMIEQAFQELLNDYLATKHRKRIEIITKAFNFANCGNVSSPQSVPVLKIFYAYTIFCRNGSQGIPVFDFIVSGCTTAGLKIYK